MSLAVVKAVGDRIAASLPAGVPVGRGGAPKSHTGRFVVVRSNTPVGESLDLADTRGRRDLTLWITSTSEDTDAQVASDEALWLAGRVQAALDGWRLNEQAWKPVHLTSQPVERDDDFPDRMVMYVVDQYGISYQQ